MTNIFLLLWLADISSKLQTGLLSAGIPLLIISTLILIIGFILSTNKEKDAQHVAEMLLKTKRWLPIPIILIIIALLLPSQNTIYIYLGLDTTSNVAATISESPLAKKTLKLLEQKLDTALNEKEESEESK